MFEENQQRAIQTKRVQTFWRIFSTNKSVTANKKKGSYKTVIPTRLDLFL
jgi:hypothetical protein